MLFLIMSIIVTVLLILRRRARLLAANQVYREALRAREDMMAIVSHDLKNPINSLVLRSHLMIQKVERSVGPDEDLKHNLQLINRTAFQMNTPVAVRYPRGTGPGVTIEAEMRALPIGKGEVRREAGATEGRKKVAILAFGGMLQPTLQRRPRRPNVLFPP